MSRAPTNAEKLAAAIQELEAERRRREDQRIAAGTAIRMPLSVVVSPGAEDAEIIEQAKAAKLAALRAEGFSGEVYFEPELIYTGVPRHSEFGQWRHEVLKPQYPDRYAASSTVSAPRPASAPATELEWTKVQIQVAPPDERSCGMIIEGARAVDGDRLHVRDHEGRTWTVSIGPGDDLDVAARRLLREKVGKHHAFNQPIHYPPRSYH
jgi:hypothetical protein